MFRKFKIKKLQQRWNHTYNFRKKILNYLSYKTVFVRRKRSMQVTLGQSSARARTIVDVETNVLKQVLKSKSTGSAQKRLKMEDNLKLNKCKIYIGDQYFV